MSSSSFSPFIHDLIHTNINRLDWKELSRNEGAIPFLQAHPDKVDLRALCQNPKGAILFEKTGNVPPNLYEFCKHPLSIPLLQKNPQWIDKCGISCNPSAMDFLIQNEGVDWFHLCENRNPEILHYFFREEESIRWADWTQLSLNPSAIRILERYPHRIKWLPLCTNINATELFQSGFSKLDWGKLSSNPCAISILEKNRANIDWKKLSMNKGASELLKKNPQFIYWKTMCYNPNASYFFEFFYKKYGIHSELDWKGISANESLIYLLEAHPDKIDYQSLSKNPNSQLWGYPPPSGGTRDAPASPTSSTQMGEFVPQRGDRWDMKVPV